MTGNFGVPNSAHRKISLLPSFSAVLPEHMRIQTMMIGFHWYRAILWNSEGSDSSRLLLFLFSSLPSVVLLCSLQRETDYLVCGLAAASRLSHFSCSTTQWGFPAIWNVYAFWLICRHRHHCPQCIPINSQGRHAITHNMICTAAAAGEIERSHRMLHRRRNIPALDQSIGPLNLMHCLWHWPLVEASNENTTESAGHIEEGKKGQRLLEHAINYQLPNCHPFTHMNT